MPNYSGVWTLSQQFQGRGQGLWPQPPGAPTIGTATAGGSLCASVTFTAPACAGIPATITGYTVTSTPGCITGTGASSPVTVSGLTAGTSYTFKAKAANATGFGACSAASNSITATLVTCATYTTAGTFSFVVPAGVTSISALAVGGGAGGGGNSGTGGGGGALSYVNNISVTPGEALTVVVASTTTGSFCQVVPGNASRLQRSATNLVAAGGGGNTGTGGQIILGTGGAGGAGGASRGGGGGAGGYSGNGGAQSSSGSGGGGGGGASGTEQPLGCNDYNFLNGGGGGGVGLYGSGSSGSGGSANTGAGGGGGSSGSSGSTGGNSGSGAGGAYGGGGGGGGFAGAGGGYAAYRGGTGGGGAVRIVWAGGARGTPSFPSTNVGP